MPPMASSRFHHAKTVESETLYSPNNAALLKDNPAPSTRPATKKRKSPLVVSPYFDHSNLKESYVLYRGAAVSPPPIRDATSTGQEASPNNAALLKDNPAPSTRPATKKRKSPLVVSPYFDHSNLKESYVLYGGAAVSPPIRDATSTSTGQEAPKETRPVVLCLPVCADTAKTKKKPVVVVSRFFNRAGMEESKASPSNKDPAPSRKRAVKKKRVVASGKEKEAAFPHPQDCACRSKWNKKADAYRRRTETDTWVPPRSIYPLRPLLQEDHVSDPWRVLVICILLNQTGGEEVEKVLQAVFRLCPNAETGSQVNVAEIERITRSLGLQKKRASTIKRMSWEYLNKDWTHVTQLHGVGKYAADAYAIFCTENWFNVCPEDHKLVGYWNLLVTRKII